MDPIAQIFQQASAPTGKWDLPAQMFIQGRQLGQSQQRLNMQQQEQDIMLPLEAEAKRLAANSTMLDLQIKRNALERDNQIKAGELELSQILLDAGKYPDGLANPELVSRGQRVGVTYPAAFFGPAGKAYMTGTQAAFAVQKAIGQFGQPTSEKIGPTGEPTYTFGTEHFQGTPLLQLQQRRDQLLRQGLGPNDVRLQEIQKDIDKLTTSDAGLGVPPDNVRTELYLDKLQKENPAVAARVRANIEAKERAVTNRTLFNIYHDARTTVNAEYRAALHALEFLTPKDKGYKEAKDAADAVKKQLNDMEKEFRDMIRNGTQAPTQPQARKPIYDKDGNEYTVREDQYEDSIKPGTGYFAAPPTAAPPP